MDHIRHKLPDMKARLITLMGQAQQELNLFGDEAAIYGDSNQVRPSCLRSSPFLTTRDVTTAGCTHPPADDAIRS
jgi:hypothetical protein